MFMFLHDQYERRYVFAGTAEQGGWRGGGGAGGGTWPPIFLKF